jgi:hypothetical protein
VFSLERKSDYRLQLTRTLKEAGRYRVELYLFTPHEGAFSEWTLTERQFYFNSLEHHFRLQGLPDLDRASKADSSFSLLSPHYEIIYGSWLFQYRASMSRLRLQPHNAEFGNSLRRALRLTQNFAQRLRKSSPEQSTQKRYFRSADVYFSWYAEQFLLESMTMEEFAGVDQELKEAIVEFLQQEYRHRRERDYLGEYIGAPTRVWNRMSMYLRMLEYPVLLRQKLVELGSGTRKMVKAASTILIMSLFTYVLFVVRDGRQEWSITLLLGIALIYALRDLLRDDMTEGITDWLRKGKPRWKMRLFKPYVNQFLALQRVWLDYRKVPELSQQVREHSEKWSSNEERQVICYRSELDLDDDALDEHQIEERLALDCKDLCEMIQSSGDKLFVLNAPDDPASGIQAHTIEKQHDYNLLVVHRNPKEDYSVAQRWQLRLGSEGIVKCKAKKLHWPSPEDQRSKSVLQRLRDKLGGN